MDLTHRSRTGAGLDLLALVAAGLLIVLLADLVGAAGLALGLFESEQQAVFTLTLLCGGLGLASVAVILQVTGGSAAGIGVTGRGLLVNQPLGLFAAALAFGLFYAAIGAIAVAYPAGFESLKGNPDRIAEVIPRLHPLGFLLLSVWVGVYEEVIFRGFVLSRLRRVLGHWWSAVLVSSLVFAVMHVSAQQPVTAIPLFAIAVGWSVVTVWRKSIVPAVIGHVLFDFLQFIGMYYSVPSDAPAV